MNDRAELVALVLAAEAIELQAECFPSGVEFVVDNMSVCDACRSISSGVPQRLHWPTTLDTVVSLES